MAQTIKVRNLKAYSVFFSIESKEEMGEFDYHRTTIIAHNSQEAENIFKKYAIAKKFYDKIDYMSIETQFKTKSNAHMFKKSFYIKQNEYVNNLYEKFKKGEKN